MHILQRYLCERYDRYEDHNNHGDGSWVAFGKENIGCHLIMDFLAKHNEACDGDGKIKEVL